MSFNKYFTKTNIPNPKTEKMSKEDCLEIEIPLHLLQFLSSPNCNIQNLCRICVTESCDELCSLTSATEKGILEGMFTSFTAIQIDPDDGLPLQICYSCRNNVISCYEFKIQCMKSDYMLKSLIRGQFTTKDELRDNVDEKNIQFPKAADKDIKIKDIKTEEDIIEDVQYLEELHESDQELLYIAQNGSTQKDVKSKNSKPRKKPVSKKKKEKKSKSHVCSFCSKRFPNIKAMKSHIKRLHGAARHSNACSMCYESFQSDHDLKLHEPIHGDGPVWTCVQCQKEFKGEIYYNPEKREWCNTDLLECGRGSHFVCEFGRSMLKRHIQWHMESKRHSCEACGKHFAELYALRRHSRVHTGERVEKRHACHLCEKRFAERSQLAAHVWRHGAARPCACACGKAFPTPRLLASHRLVHDDTKPHRCRYCDKRFRHESTRNTHHRTHTGERPYVCATCGKRFIQNSNLTLHMRTHTGERPYACDTCGRSFSSGSTLKSHMRTHTGDKPFDCHICGKRFARKDLRAHTRQHTGERPFACSACGRRFITAARMREHSRTHTGERPFHCTTCTLKFTSKSQLVKHEKVHKPRSKKTVVTSEPYKPIREDKIVVATEDSLDNVSTIEVVECDAKEVVIGHIEHDDTEVSGEVILSNEDTEMSEIQSGALCLTSAASDVNVVTVRSCTKSIKVSYKYLVLENN